MILAFSLPCRQQAQTRCPYSNYNDNNYSLSFCHYYCRSADVYDDSCSDGCRYPDARGVHNGVSPVFVVIFLGEVLGLQGCS